VREMNTPNVTIKLKGHVDDLYALSLLFPEGAHPDLHIVTDIIGAKDGPWDRVQNIDHQDTFLAGRGCLALMQATSPQMAGWMARELLAPLNGYAVLADSNFKPAVPVSASWKQKGGASYVVFDSGTMPNRPTRAIPVNRHVSLQQLRASRVKFMSENPLAAYAATAIAGPPSWAEYYRLLEDIAGHRGTTLDKLSEVGLAKRQALQAFRKAANNRAFGRHGTSKRDVGLSQDELMNLLEAHEFIRTVVSKWLDIECGGRMPRDRVDGGPLRFGLDEP
jgi:hypothetical protein